MKGEVKMGVCEEIKPEVVAEALEGKSEHIARKLIKAGKETLDEIADICELPIQQVQELADEIDKESYALGFAIGKAQASVKIAFNCIKSRKFTLEAIAEACDLTLNSVRELAASL